MKTVKIYEPIYHTHLLLIYGCDYVKAENYLSENGIRVDLKKCTGYMGSYTYTGKDKSEQQRYYIVVKKNDKGTLEEKATLIHEVSHLVFMALHDCGIEISQRTDEIYSYYLEWWFKEIIKALNMPWNS